MAPERWTRPLIQSVTLPAHAQTSSPEIELSAGPWAGGGGSDVTELNTSLHSRNLVSRIADSLISPANAGEQSPDECISSFIICIEKTGSGDEIEVRNGFDGFERDRQTFTPSNALTFSRTFDDWLVAGEYDPGGDRWTGTVDGPCPFRRFKAQNKGIFTGERIQVASASERLQLAGTSIEPDPGVSIPWTAERNAPCTFLL